MAIISDFEQAYKITLSHEGGYSNDPNDNGGETIFGIARKKQPNWKGWVLVDSKKGSGFPQNALTDPTIISATKEFYKKEFWDINRLGEIDQLIASELFDTGVNQGTGTAAKYLQEALNLLNNNGSHFPDIVIDGGIGDGTMRTYTSYINTYITFKSRTKEKNINILLKAINGLQFYKYREIAKNNPTQEQYFYGWVSRT